MSRKRKRKKKTKVGLPPPLVVPPEKVLQDLRDTIQELERSFPHKPNFKEVSK
jgi:hypothetical protein